jgi:pimeloyl-ACP methyl ester carboxylesterase
MRIGADGLGYDDEGRGRALLLFHAFPLHRSMWDEQAKALARSVRVLRLDARGFGESAPADGPLTMDRIADDGARLLERLGIETAVVGGCSMGGYAAFAFARRHPRRLEGLYLQDTKAPPDTDEARANRRTLAERVLALGPSAAAEALLPKLVGDTTHRERPQVVARVRADILAAAPLAIAAALDGLAAREDSRPTLEAIRVPALVVVGEEDVLTPPAEAEATASGIAGARLVRVPAAGHLANLEAPGPVSEAIAGFLAALPPTTSPVR